MSRSALPRDKLPDGTAAIGLVAERGSHLSLAHAEAAKDAKRTVRMSCAPGTFYVVAYGASSSAWGQPSAMRRVRDALEPDDGRTFIGKVTISKGDAGKRLNVEPLGR